MSAPRFSVVIPTRERSETLRYTLRTCLNQAHDNYEIVVCDNCGSPATRRVVEEFASPKIRYARSAEPLAMSSNWELAVSHAAGEWVAVIGDDDALLPHAVHEWERLIAFLPEVRALRWNGVYYSWPSITLPGQGNYLRLPLGRRVRVVESRTAIAAVIAFEACYSSLPMFYNALIHRSLIDELRRRVGRIFVNCYPDVYSGFAVASVAGAFASIDYPMTVAGTSGGSFGVATLFFRGRSPLDQEFRDLNGRDRLTAHPLVPDLPIFPAVPVADSFQFARERLFPDDGLLVLDRQQLIIRCVDGIRAETEADWRIALDVIRQTLADDGKLLRWFDTAFADRHWSPPPPVCLRSSTLGFDGSCLHLDTAAHGVVDVEGAATLCARLLCPDPAGVHYDLPEQPAASPATAPAQAAPAQAAEGTAPHVTQLQWVENALHRLLRDGIRTRCLIDVGAHHGTTLGPFLRSGWRVIAFEPFEDNRRRLEENFGANPLLTSRAEAVSDCSGTRNLRLALNLDGTLHEYHHSLEAIGDDAWHKKGPTVPVRTITLDELVERGEVPSPVGFLKIDTEGHDLAVLLGASRLSCEIISVEFWNAGHAFGTSPSPAEKMIALLGERGFEDFLVVSHHLDNTVVLRSTLEGTRADSWGNLFFFHRSCRDLYQSLLHDPEWLFVLEQARQLDELNNDRRAKEVAVRELSAAAAQRLGVIEELSRAAAERLAVIEELDKVAVERLACINSQAVRLKSLEEEVRRLRTAGESRGLLRLLGRLGGRGKGRNAA